MVETVVPLPKKNFNWLYDLLLIGILLMGAYFRLGGSDWGQLNIQHPDENFMTSVTLGLQTVHNLADYFNTAKSTLNPGVVGYPAYVYGTLPLFIVHGLAESFGRLNAVTLFGRQLSGIADLGTIALMYFIARRFYSRWVALLGAAFSAITVMEIQQSHFYTTDNFSTFFMFLTLLVAAIIATGKWKHTGEKAVVTSTGGSSWSRIRNTLIHSLKDGLVYLSAAFGIALGMAVASKLNAAAMSVVLPIALLVRYFGKLPKDSAPAEGVSDDRAIHPTLEAFIPKAIVFLVIGAIFSVLSFRVFQPYAFSGPGFFDLKLNPEWMQKVHEQLLQASPNADLNWALQWARRNHLYSFQNLTEWGLGLPLGILAWAGFLWMGWRILKGEWRQHVLLWSWTGIYFIWQSLQYNPTMRYQLPVYPILGMIAAWVIFDWARPRPAQFKKFNWRGGLVAMIGLLVFGLTAAYAYGFSRIYIRPETRMAASNWIYQNIPGPININIETVDGTLVHQLIPFSTGSIIQSDMPYKAVFVSQSDGTLSSIMLLHVTDAAATGPQTLKVILSAEPDPTPDKTLASLAVTKDFTPAGSQKADPLTLTLNHPIAVQRGITYYLQIQTSGGVITLVGSPVANETDYDYPLPFRTAVYDAFGGIYPGGINLQVYWDDNAAKLALFQVVLDQADYIFIPTNHQYAQITRLPERYPLTTEYYRQLIGCPPEKNIIWCYRVAKKGMFQGALGFDLMATFESYPSIGPLVINDQSAEEAFTFYDHPKVLIFKKNTNYSQANVQAVLGKIDYSQAIHLTPGQADTYKSLLLPTDQLAAQQKGGTWSDLFKRDALYNRHPVLGLLIWYLVIFALGLVCYPLVRAAFPGLEDRGYPLSRIIGLLLWAWLAWMAGSVGLSYTKLTIGLSLAIIIVAGLWQAWRQRFELLQEFREQRKYFLMVEVVFLSFFLIDLFIRIGNPDLWHSSKGGERPMNFAYFNAVLKSTSFPPYDPWFAGGYINYYYYGYVIVGTPVKLLGIVPSVAYNFLLPTLFACLAVSAFSVGWNILHEIRNAKPGEEEKPRERLFGTKFISGISASSAMVLLGNLGVIHMLYQGFQRVASPGGVIDKANLIQRIWWTLKGIFMVLGGMRLPFGRGDWYWFSSRIFPPVYSEFYEFPVFTFIYSDLHAHMIALMLTVLVISWVLSILVSKARWSSPGNAVIGYFLGGLIIGSLKPTNTWDFYTYFTFGAIVLVYTVWRYSNTENLRIPIPGWGKRLLLAGGALAALAALSILMYQPFSHWFSQAYTSIESWKGARTPISTYLTQWGVFLFFIVSWMTWETRQWLATTPISALGKLRPYRDLIVTALVIILMVLILQQAWVMSSSQNVPWKGVSILWLALPLAIWAAVLIFRPGISDLKRLVLFMFGTGLLLTMTVELIVVAGDIGRFNTVFKFGVQSWILLGISAAAAFGWLASEFRKWLPGWRTAWQVSAITLATGASLVLLIGGADKIGDRMTSAAPHTLDSMSYMNYAMYADYGMDMDLREDYRAIIWMQDKVQGSPVIVEAASAGVQYRWHQRFSIYTGLPDVVGWEWHQVQQRVLDSAKVIARGKEVDNFYATTDITTARDFLRKYKVRYIIVGQLEIAKYTPGNPGGSVPPGVEDGLLKFEANNNFFWHEVYRDKQTVIYEVPEISEGTR